MHKIHILLNACFLFNNFLMKSLYFKLILLTFFKNFLTKFFPKIISLILHHEVYGNPKKCMEIPKC